MRNYRPSTLGDSWFDWIETSPGRIDPSSGELVDTTALPEKDQKGMFDWIETSPGRINPRTGKLRVPTTLPPEAREKLKSSGKGAPPARNFSRFAPPSPEGRSPRRASDVTGAQSQQDLTEWSPRGESMNGRGFGVGCGCNEAGESNGYGVGCGCSEMGESRGGSPGAILWIFLGVTGLIALEALGVTNLTKAKQNI